MAVRARKATGESWQARMKREAEEAHERALGEPRPWWVHLFEPCYGLFAKGDAETLAVCAALYGMRAAFALRASDTDGVAWVELKAPCEWIVCDEWRMRDLMRAVRRSALHGSYRKAGTEKEYEF